MHILHSRYSTLCTRVRPCDKQQVLDCVSTRAIVRGCAHAHKGSRIVLDCACTHAIRAGAVAITRAHTAPDPCLQMMGAELTEAVDVWALALLLWEVMTETKPWDGVYADFAQLREAVCRGERIAVPAAAAATFPAEYLAMIREGTNMKVAPLPFPRYTRTTQLHTHTPRPVGSIEASMFACAFPAALGNAQGLSLSDCSDGDLVMSGIIGIIR
jgi:hypothetical protein